jgi:hypothetical protein
MDSSDRVRQRGINEGGVLRWPLVRLLDGAPETPPGIARVRPNERDAAERAGRGKRSAEADAGERYIGQRRLEGSAEKSGDARHTDCCST